MAATDKDVFQKTKAIRFCLATGLIPFYEVNVCNIREFADKPELLTDIDVFGDVRELELFERHVEDALLGHRDQGDGCDASHL